MNYCVMLVCIRQKTLQGTESALFLFLLVQILIFYLWLFLACKKALCFLLMFCHAGVTSSPMTMVKSSYLSGSPGMCHPSSLLIFY